MSAHLCHVCPLPATARFHDFGYCDFHTWSYGTAPSSCSECDGRGELRSAPHGTTDWTCPRCKGSGYADPVAARVWLEEDRRRAVNYKRRRARYVQRAAAKARVQGA